MISFRAFRVQAAAVLLIAVLLHACGGSNGTGSPQTTSTFTATAGQRPSPTSSPLSAPPTSTATSVLVTPTIAVPPSATSTPTTPIGATATTGTTPTSPAGVTTATPSGVRINLVPRRLSDGTVVVDVVLVGGNGEVAGMQNDIVFDTTVLRLDSPADCTINPALSDTPPDPQECVPDANGNVAGACKALGRRLVTCGRSPEPAGCPAGADSTVGVFRGLLAASTNALNSNPIPDGVLYTCTFTVVSESPAPTTLSNSNVVVAATNGAQLPVNAGDGVIELVPSPTATPPIDNAIHIDLVAHALSAGTVSVDVVLLGGGARVAGMQNDIVFDNTVVQLNSPANCRLNPALSDNPPNPDDCVPDANNHEAPPTVCKSYPKG